MDLRNWKRLIPDAGQFAWPAVLVARKEQHRSSVGLQEAEGNVLADLSDRMRHLELSTTALDGRGTGGRSVGRAGFAV